jgi:hypothetical protein
MRPPALTPGVIAGSDLLGGVPVVWLPQGLDRQQREGWVELTAESIRVQVKEEGRFAMRGLILYPTKTGVEVLDGKDRHLVISWDRMMQSP